MYLNTLGMMITISTTHTSLSKEAYAATCLATTASLTMAPVHYLRHVTQEFGFPFFYSIKPHECHRVVEVVVVVG